MVYDHNFMADPIQDSRCSNRPSKSSSKIWTDFNSNESSTLISLSFMRKITKDIHDKTQVNYSYIAKYLYNQMDS